jgi:RNAse (barnase) inhibitor barstar
MKHIHIIERNQTRPHRDGVYVVHIKGEENKTLDEVYDTIGDQMKVPPYFTRNMDSILELLCDLSWMHERIVEIVISNYEEFLQNEMEDIRFEFLYILSDATYEWESLGGKDMNIYIETCDKIDYDLEECGLK